MNKLITIIGPTAVGKTALSFALAAYYRTELISGDAYQIYRHMDIGTAKPTKEELAQYRHHLINIVNPSEAFSAVRFRDEAAAAIQQIQQWGKIPILVGGTGLYVQSLLEGYSFSAAGSDEEHREKARQFIQAHTAEEIRAFIKKETQWEPPDWHEWFANSHRLVRLITAILMGDGYAYVRSEKAAGLVYDAYVIGLDLPRETLYERIDQRVDQMLASGWIDEVKNLLKDGVSPQCQAMKAIGYEELTAYVQGTMSLDDVAASIKKRTRHFAKRQLSWYKRMPYIHWFHKNEYTDETAMATAIIHEIDHSWNLGTGKDLK